MRKITGVNIFCQSISNYFTKKVLCARSLTDAPKILFLRLHFTLGENQLSQSKCFFFEDQNILENIGQN